MAKKKEKDFESIMNRSIAPSCQGNQKFNARNSNKSFSPGAISTRGAVKRSTSNPSATREAPELGLDELMMSKSRQPTPVRKLKIQGIVKSCTPALSDNKPRKVHVPFKNDSKKQTPVTRHALKMQAS